MSSTNLNRLPVTSDSSGIPTNWDWKGWYVDQLANGAGMEVFSQNSVSPDTTLLLAGPPRIAVEGFTEALSPLGLVNNLSITTDNQLRPIWEIGTSETFFTRGKAIHNLQIGAMVANKPSLMKVLTRQSPTASSAWPKDNHGQFWMDLDSESIAKPFGILVLFNAKAASDKGRSSTKISAVYLENCNINNFNMGISSQDIFIQENLMIMFDRMVSVDYTTSDYDDADEEDTTSISAS